MGTGELAFSVVALIALLAAIPIRSAVRRSAMFETDYLLLALPTALFCASVVLLNPEPWSMWTLIFYGFFTFFLSVAVLFARVFVLDRLASSPRLNSSVCFALASAVAFIAGATIRQIYE